jgi:hypothetical protein
MSICSTASRPPPAPEQLFHLRPAGQSVSTPPRPATPGPKSTEPPQSSTGNAPRRDHRRRSEAADPRVSPQALGPRPVRLSVIRASAQGKTIHTIRPEAKSATPHPPRGPGRPIPTRHRFPHPRPPPARTPAPNRSTHRPEEHRRQRRHHHHRHSRLAMEVFLHGTDGPPVAES